MLLAGAASLVPPKHGRDVDEGRDMLTFFTTAKPFRGHSGVIQRNALKSWTLLHPDVEVILFGEDEGAGEAARELGIRHEPHTEKNEAGSNRMDYMFLRAQEIARHDVLCYSNCDILLLQDFCEALSRVKEAHSKFLMVGRRWDTEINEPLLFERNDWRAQLRNRALRESKLRTPDYVDYFAFSRGVLGGDLPPLVVGRVFWDNWTIWKALNAGRPVVDVSAAVVAVHQNHDYSHVPQGKDGVYSGEEARRNYELAGGWSHLRTIADATEVLSEDGLKPNYLRWWAAGKRYLGQAWRVLLHDVIQPAWFLLLGITRPMRHALGLRAGTLQRSREKI
jgi:hypothetical protein